MQLQKRLSISINFEMNVLVIIPARGGSKGIPRKNLRPLAGKPLIYYSINAGIRSKYKPDVYVSTDDEEIAFFSKSFGAQVYMRDPKLADDKVTLDPVIYEAYETISKASEKKYDLIVTFQPTSPLVTSTDLDLAIEKMINSPEIDTVITAVNDTHLTWKLANGKYAPNYEKRVNRQQLPPVYKETGAFLITRSHIIEPNKRIGATVSLLELRTDKAIDIDSYEDWNICEYLLNRKRIVFCLTGYNEIGLGHVYNCLVLASEILNHSVVFLVDKKSQLAFDKISNSNYTVHLQESEDIVDDIVKLSPYLVINDRLDTEVSYVKALKEKGYKVLNIEDLGEGATLADSVVNAIYPEKNQLPNHYFGPDYFCLRDEFLISDPISIRPDVSKVVLTFGGTDPSNLTRKTLAAIYQHCLISKIEIHVILGLGYPPNNLEAEFPLAIFYKNIKAVSEVMKIADIAFSSAGRTTYELAALGIPSIILCQNERELSHFFTNEENGFRSLGLGKQVSDESIKNEFIKIGKSESLRKEMHFAMLSKNIRKGKVKVLEIINNLLK
jgi:CMP-N-acetylneuraminic acid synthetase/spore coat polysaccharide biosynthesis predicted glycosyltransferase SpsG